MNHFPKLEIHLLGAPQISYNGVVNTERPSAKAQALLYYLAMTGRTHTRVALASLLWAEYGEGEARRNLRKAIQQLREHFEPYLAIDHHSVGFHSAQVYWVDAVEFATQIAETLAAHPKRLQQTIALYHGDFLEGFYVREAPEFETWMFSERARLRELLLQGVDTLAVRSAGQGDLPQAIAWARRLLELEPWREESHRQLMLWLVQDGQRGAALAQFEACRHSLAEELAVEPDAETVAVVEAIRAGDADRVKGWQDPPISVTLPIPPTPLIGRERELAELGELMGNSQGRLITITGPGGIGKTRLALELTARMQTMYQHGAYFVELMALGNPDLVASALLSALGLASTNPKPPQLRLLEFLRHKELLLLLDNFEHLMSAVSLVAELLTTCPRVRILVTSRERLHLRAEQQFPVLPLELAAAVTLFVQRAQAIEPTFTLTATDPPVIAKLCRQLDCLPLAIELLAARIDLFSPRTMLTRLQEQRLDLLVDGQRDLPVRHQTLRKTIQHSYDLLDARERTLLRTLGVFVGGFDLASVMYFGFDEATLQSLINKSLVKVEAQVKSERRFRLLETLRNYACDQLTLHDELHFIQRRYAQYFLALAEDAQRHVGSREETFWYDRLEANHDNLRATLQWLLTTDTPTAVHLAGVLGEFWYIRGYYSEGRDWLKRALGQYNDAPALAQGWALRKAGKLALAQSDYAQATTLFETSMEVYHKLEDAEGIASSLNFLGVVALNQNHLEQAEQFFEQSLMLRRELNEREEIAASLHNLSLVAMCQHNFSQATAFLNESLAIFDNDGDVDAVSIFRTSAGYLKLYQENVPDAVAHFMKAIALALEQSDKQTIIVCLEGFAYVASLYEVGKEGRRQAVRLLSVADTLRINLGAPLPSMHRSLYDKSISAILAQISEADFAIAWNEGQMMTPEQAIAYDLTSVTGLTPDQIATLTALGAVQDTAYFL